MSDCDSLDELLEDVDMIDDIVQKQSDEDLDALLDDVAAAYDPADQDEDVDDIGITGHLESSQERRIDSAFIGVPFHLRKKWADFLKEDLEVEDETRHISSYAYRSWESDAMKFSIDKSLKETIMKVSSKCGLNTAQSNRIESVVLGDSSMKSLLIRQIIADRKEQILVDPNFDPAAYPSLAKVLEA